MIQILDVNMSMWTSVWWNFCQGRSLFNNMPFCNPPHGFLFFLIYCVVIRTDQAELVCLAKENKVSGVILVFAAFYFSCCNILNTQVLLYDVRSHLWTKLETVHNLGVFGAFLVFQLIICYSLHILFYTSNLMMFY